MRVRSITVKRLFGLFDHEIPLQNIDRVTIVHGPNGIGKTVILRMIAGLVEGKKDVFEHTPFDEFSVVLDDGSARVIRRTVDRDPQSKKRRVNLEFYVRDHTGILQPVLPLPPPGDLPRKTLSLVDNVVPVPYRLSGTGWIDDVGNTYSLAEIIEKFPQAAEALPRKYRPGRIFDISQNLEVFFVETNRLATEVAMTRQGSAGAYYYVGSGSIETSTESTPRVRHYSDDIVQRIKTVLTDYARHSQERDRTFPERLVRFVRDRHATLAEREILSRMTELENKRRRLISLGLLDSESGLRDLNEEDVRRAPEALTIYVGDIEEKLKVFDDLARRIGSLIDILNSRFKYKQITVGREYGFRIVSELGEVIGLQDLSSGEQHEIVVLYELLFRGPKSGLVLVDEPEISLHVAWQSRFLSDLISILAPTDSYAIVATHSPVIIGTRTDLAVELQGPNTNVRDVHDA